MLQFIYDADFSMSMCYEYVLWCHYSFFFPYNSYLQNLLMNSYYYIFYILIKSMTGWNKIHDKSNNKNNNYYYN